MCHLSLKQDCSREFHLLSVKYPRACQWMEQVSDEEVDHAAEEDSDKEDQDLDKMFGAWLGELDKLTQSLDDGKPDQMRKSPLRQETNLANFSYRFSMYNLNEALNQGDAVDLDALMADLCSIEQELSTIGSKPSAPKHAQATEQKVRQKPPAGRSGAKHSSSARASPSSTVRGHKPMHSNYSLDDITAQLEQASLSMDEAARQSGQSLPPPTIQHRRTGSAGTVSDADVRSISNSSRSSFNSAASSMDSLDIDKVLRPQELDILQQGQPSTEHAPLRRPSKQTKRHLDFTEEEVEVDLSTEEQAAKLKAEKIRVALEKIKEAQVKKLVIRVHMSDDSSKTMMVDERQTVRQVLDSLLDKSHCGYSPDWSLVETISELQMERIFEDHENLVENLVNWTRDSQNKLMFIERIEKYALFKNPQNYLLGKKETSEMADRKKEALLEECFCGSSVTVPEIEGVLWLKDDGKKSWKKRYFLLRASGIYYVPKGKAKVSRDLVCFLQLDHVNIYYGQDYRNKYKAPSDYCLALKHPQIQKKSQYIKYLCCDDVRTLHQWVNGIHIAKYGKQLYVNYQEAMKRTEAAYDWSSLSNSSIKSGSSSSSIPESHSNHSDSGVSDSPSSGHVRSQSIVSSIFSEAWKRGTQMEETSKIVQSEELSASSTELYQQLNCCTLVTQGYKMPTLLWHMYSVSPPAPPAKSGSPVKKASKTSSPGGKRPPPTPQRNSSIKSASSAEYQESKKVENLKNKFGQAAESSSSSSSGSPSKDSTGPPAPPKPGKLNLSNLPMIFPQGKGGTREPTADFPSPPSDYDFPPPPPDYELLLPPPAEPPGAPKVAVVNPQPQAWNKSSLKKTPPPTLPRRNDGTRLSLGEGPEPPTTPPPHQQQQEAPQPPTSPKGNLSVQPNFLADLNRTLQRKSITRHSSLSSARMSKLEPTTTMDDMALPPPPPELLFDQQKQGSYMSGNISGYATLRRGPPPAPPKRDQSTKLTGEW
ncbi:Ras-associated and pleckstrin homology domains-containing protein 1 [Acipenser ruthenus]|uniref:Ras-associated and pleckstrin homology domains-containing protein 1 n=1 Tax=Acipenser ruthenus TaxID=7906 RepID=A0A444UAB3_ACIRT|nr:Ras-associated and pleckstrin homology domains-containing protein 1 [Acipenser ruthenus]